jgi:hypothetical protein
MFATIVKGLIQLSFGIILKSFQALPVHVCKNYNIFLWTFNFKDEQGVLQHTRKKNKVHTKFR